MFYILITLFVLLLTLFARLYRCLQNSRNYFKNAGIPCIESHWLFGDLQDSTMMRKPFSEDFTELYRKLEPHRFAGFYNLFQTGIMIRDPELIRQILVKDFSYFQDHGFPCPKDDLGGSTNLFFLEGEKWKNMRNKLTKAFSSGKMKMMFPLVKKCAENIKPALMEYISSDDGFESRLLGARYMTDVIASCAFGIDMQSLKHPDSEFRMMESRIFENRIDRWPALLRFLVPALPKWLVELFDQQSINKDFIDDFEKSVRNVIKYREENNVKRDDFLDLLNAMKKRTDSNTVNGPQKSPDSIRPFDQEGEFDRSDVEMTIEEITAQCFQFLLGGFEGTSVALSLFLFELAQNNGIQNKVRDEIMSNIANNGGEVTYDLLKKMIYLDMALKETMRKYALSGGILIRACNENYKIPESEVIIKKGTSVMIPMIGLQTDKKYFEKPDEFYPEHFTKEAISQRSHFTYLPFGEGPRVCIAERFANMQMLMAAIYLIKDFSFEVSSKTIVPLEFLPSSGGGLLPVKGGTWIKCQPRF